MPRRDAQYGSPRERTLIIVKHKHVPLADKILGELDGIAKRIATVRVPQVPRNVIEEHYAQYKEKPYFRFMIEDFVGKEVVLAVYEGSDVIARMVEAIGPTDPSKAPPNTIRGKYSRDSLEDALAMKRPLHNVVHRSDSRAEADREIAIWRMYLPDQCTGILQAMCLYLRTATGFRRIGRADEPHHTRTPSRHSCLR